MLHTVRMCTFEQGAAIGRVIAVILERVGDRLRNHRMCCKMHDRVDIVLTEYAIQQGCVTRIANNQPACSNRSLETRRQVVQNHDVFACGAKLLNDVATYITCSACNQDTFVCHTNKSRCFRAKM